MKATLFTICIFLLLSISIKSFSQDSEKKLTQSLYSELLGSGYLYSLNYEIGFGFADNHIRINARVGGTSIYFEKRYLLPIVGGNIEFGGGKHFLQLSANRIFHIAEGSSNNHSSYGIGYVRRSNNSFYFHATLLIMHFDSPITLTSSSNKLQTFPWPSVGLGYTF